MCMHLSAMHVYRSEKKITEFAPLLPQFGSWELNTGSDTAASTFTH